MGGIKTGADFLKIPVGAEAAGLGQAYSALSNGVNSLTWNPAGIAQRPSYLPASSFGLGLSHQEHFIDTTLDHIGLLLPDRNHWTGGLSVVRLSYSDQESRTIDRQRTGSFSSYDLSVGAALARNFGAFQLGTQIKFLSMELAGYSAKGAAADIGFLTQLPASRLLLGGSIRNIGPKMKFISEEFNLPLTYALGAAFRVTGPLSISCDLQNRPYQNHVAMSFGTEYIASKTVSLRAGYLATLAEAIDNNQESETNRGSFGGVAGLAAGLGLHFQRFTIDYSITPFGELGNTHSFSLATAFGNSAPARNIEPLFEEPAPAMESEDTEEDNRDILILPADEKPWWEPLKQ